MTFKTRHGLVPVVSLALVLAVVPGVRAEDDAEEAFPPPESPPPAVDTPKEEPASSAEGRRAIKLPNFHGLSGMRDMVDARTPEGLTIRGGVRVQEERENTRGKLMELDREQLDLQAYAGVALFSFVEAGGRIPFEFNKEKKGFRVNGPDDRERENDIGDVELAAKLSLPMGPVTLGPYAVAIVPTGKDREFDRKRGADVGAAVAIGVVEERIVFHGNVAGVWREGGDTGLRWRVGMSVVPLASTVLTLRPYVYVDGLQRFHEDSGTEIRVAAGAQAILLELLTFEIGADYRVHSRATPSELADDRGTFRVELGAGVAF